MAPSRENQRALLAVHVEDPSREPHPDPEHLGPLVSAAGIVQVRLRDDTRESSENRREDQSVRDNPAVASTTEAKVIKEANQRSLLLGAGMTTKDTCPRRRRRAYQLEALGIAAPPRSSSSQASSGSAAAEPAQHLLRGELLPVSRQTR
eukprot:scaffold8226_cov286-Pinguiococcus_pyrenoidosus.AAC.2